MGVIVPPRDNASSSVDLRSIQAIGAPTGVFILLVASLLTLFFLGRLVADHPLLSHYPLLALRLAVPLVLHKMGPTTRGFLTSATASWPCGAPFP